MMGSTIRAPADRTVRSHTGRIHLLLGIQSLIVVLLSINRLSPLTLGYVLPNQFLRWVDFNNMLILPLASVVAFYLLKKLIETPGPALNSLSHQLLNLAFLVGVYLLAASYGAHEVTNYLHTRFCLDDPGSDICRIIIFNDDSFSHWLFFLGFILVNLALMLFQAVFPWQAGLTGLDRLGLVFNGMFIGAGVFANLAFEEIGLDLYVVLLLALVSIYLLVRRGLQPLFLYYTTAYSLGLVATVLYRALAG